MRSITKDEKRITRVAKVCYIVGSIITVVGFVGLAVSVDIFRVGMIFGFIVIFLSIILHLFLGEDTTVEMF